MSKILEKQEKTKEIVDITRYNRYNNNKDQFYKLYNLFKQFLGVIIIDNMPSTSKSFNMVHNYVYQIKYEIKENSNNNFIVDFNFQIVKENEKYELGKISELLLFLINKTIFITFIDLIDNQIKVLDYKEIMKTLIKKMKQYYHNIKKDLEEIFIEFDDKILNIDNLLIFQDYYRNIGDYSLLKDTTIYSILFEMFINNDLINQQNVVFEIYELIELLYFDFIESYLNYNDYFKSKGFLDFNQYFLNHGTLIIKNDMIKITPLIKYSNLYLHESIIDKQNMNIKISYHLSKTILNGRFFFSYFYSSNPFISFKATPNRLNISQLFEENSRILFDIRHNTDLKNLKSDDAFWELFGVFINEFAIADISLINLYNEKKIGINIQICTNDPTKLSKDFNTNNSIIFRIFEVININELRDWWNFLIDIKKYFRSIFMTYPQHSTVIGCSDLLYYYNLYNYFPTLKRYKVPLVENSEDIIKNIEYEEKLISYHLVRENIKPSNLIKAFEEFESDKNKIKSEVIKLKQYIKNTDFLLNVFGMNFGQIENINVLNANYKFANRMPKYNGNYNVSFPSNMTFTKLKETIDFCVLNGYLYDINYFIENFMKTVKTNLNSRSNYQNLTHILTEIKTLRDRDYFIIYPYDTINIPNTDRKAYLPFGLNLIFIKSNDDVLTLKLNKLAFNLWELESFQKLFKNVSSNIHLDDLIADNQNKIYKLYSNNAILIENVEVGNCRTLINNNSNFMQILNETYDSIFEQEQKEYLSDEKDWIYKDNRQFYKDFYRR